MRFSLASALVYGTRPGSAHGSLGGSLGGAGFDARRIHVLLPVADHCCGGSAQALLAGTPDSVFAALYDTAGEYGLSVEEAEARVDGSRSYSQLQALLGETGSPGSWLVKTRALSVQGEFVGELLYGAIHEGVAIGASLLVSENHASASHLVLSDSATPTLMPAILAPAQPGLSEWLRRRAASGASELQWSGPVISPSLQCPLDAALGETAPEAVTGWEPNVSPDFGSFLQRLSGREQRIWLTALERGCVTAHATACEACFALQAVHVALAALPAEAGPLWEGPCLEASGLGADLFDARTSLLRFALDNLVPPDMASEAAAAHMGGWAEGEAAPPAWAGVGTSLRVRLPRGERADLLRALEHRAQADGGAPAAMFALITTLVWQPGVAQGAPPASFTECLAATWRALGRLPTATRCVPMRAQLVSAWRAALRLRSDSELLGWLQARCSEAQLRRAQAPVSPPRQEALPRGRAVFRGTVHSSSSDAGASGECLVFNFKVETALDFGGEDPVAFGVRFDANCMAAGHTFESIMEGDTVEAEGLVLEEKRARATGVSVVRRGSLRPADARRRSQLARDELIASAPSAAAAAPTLPGWVQAEGVNHDGAPLWAGPCSACGVLCTVPFRPRQPVGFAVSSPPLCRHCRTAQLSVQAQAAGTIPAMMYSPRGTPPAGMIYSRGGSYPTLNPLAMRGLSLSPAPSPPPPSVLGSFGGAACEQSLSTIRRSGVVKFWKSEQGFGFIQPLSADGAPSAEADIFVHVTQAPVPVHPDAPSLCHGQLVEFSEAVVYGRRQAMAVSLVGGMYAQTQTPARDELCGPFLPDLGTEFGSPEEDGNGASPEEAPRLPISVQPQRANTKLFLGGISNGVW